MERKEAIRGAYRMTGGNSFYDGMITCSTLSGKAVCRLVWATEDYSRYGFGKADEIYVRSITGANGNIIRPRTEKTKKEQQTRIKDKAEVFTPSWVCNKQNNLVDNA